MSTGVGEYDFEPIRGLPAYLPEGEDLLWQGAPEWRALAISAFHVRKVAIYFVVLATWNMVSGWSDGMTFAGIISSVTWTVTLGVVAMAILTLLAWLYARTTVYTVTSKRFVIRFGLALPMTINLPFAVIESAAVIARKGETGDIAMTTQGRDRIAYLHLWPNVRPWKFKRPQPMLRAIADVNAVGEIVGNALAAAIGEDSAQRSATAQPSEKSRDEPGNASGLVPAGE